MDEELRKQLAALGFTQPPLTNGSGPTLPGGGGVDAGAFQRAIARPSSSGSDVTIPIFRDRSANQRSAKRFIREGADNKAERALKVAPTAEQFAKEMAVAQFAKILMDKDMLEQWQALVVKAGILTAAQATDAVKLQAAWEKAVEWAINMKAATNGKTELTPFEALEAVAQNTGAAALAAQEYAKEAFTGKKTQTTRTVDTSYNAQRGEALRQLLGRMPTAEEKKAYMAGLSAIAKENPQTVTSTGTFQEGELVSTEQNITGGFDENEAQFLAAASASPEVAIQQQSTTYYDALVDALNAAV